MIKTKENLEKVTNDIDECSANWIKHLCNLGNEHHYQKISMVSKSVLLGIMKYRRELRGQGVGNISFMELNTAYTEADNVKLHKLLEELFLEPLSKYQFDFILKKINKAEGTMIAFYNKHMEDVNKLALTVALEL